MFVSTLFTDDVLSKLPLNILVNLCSFMLGGDFIESDAIVHIIKSQRTNKKLQSFSISSCNNYEYNVDRVTSCFLDETGKVIPHLINSYAEGQKFVEIVNQIVPSNLCYEKNQFEIALDKFTLRAKNEVSTFSSHGSNPHHLLPANTRKSDDPDDIKKNVVNSFKINF